MTAMPLTSSAGTSSSLLVRLELRRSLPLPFLKPRLLDVPVTDLSLSHRLTPEAAPTSTATPSEIRRQQAAQLAFERSHIMTAPFRHLSYACWKALTALSRVWTRDGFVSCAVRGRAGVWKLDRRGGWALDGGRGVDRLLRLAPSS